MSKSNKELEAIAITPPAITTVLNPNTLTEDTHLGYQAAVQYQRKEPKVRLILCSNLDQVTVGEPVMITYHSGMKCYQHSRQVVVSNPANCIGGFYFTNGQSAS